MGINWKVRLKNPVFLAQLVMAIFMPILAYMGITLEDVTSWQALGQVVVQAIGNPYILLTVVISVWNAVNDPTTKGVVDSRQAMEYTEAK